MDIRSQRTKKQIGECFLALLNQKPASKITVTEICEKIPINRATFYKHYLDIPDLLEKQVEEILEKLQAIINAYDSQQTEKLLLETLRYMRSEGACYYALGSENGDPNLPMKTFELLYQSEFPVLEKSIPDLTQQQKEMLYHYLSQGCGGVLSYWIHNGMTQEPEEIADFIMQASIATVTVFNRK